MPRAKKKSVSQHVIATAALGLPAPARAIVSTKWGAPLLVIVVIGLLATGVASIDWSDGSPHLKFDKERTAEIRQEVRDKVEHAVAQKKEPEHKTLDSIEQIGARFLKGHQK